MNCGIGEMLSNRPMANVSQIIQPLFERVLAIIASPESWPAQLLAGWLRRGLALEQVFSPHRNGWQPGPE
jgi:hypothetical protein